MQMIIIQEFKKSMYVVLISMLLFSIMSNVLTGILLHREFKNNSKIDNENLKKCNSNYNTAISRHNKYHIELRDLTEKYLICTNTLNRCHELLSDTSVHVLQLETDLANCNSNLRQVQDDNLLINGQLTISKFYHNLCNDDLTITTIDITERNRDLIDCNNNAVNNRDKLSICVSDLWLMSELKLLCQGRLAIRNDDLVSCDVNLSEALISVITAEVSLDHCTERLDGITHDKHELEEKLSTCNQRLDICYNRLLDELE